MKNSHECKGFESRPCATMKLYSVLNFDEEISKNQSPNMSGEKKNMMNSHECRGFESRPCVTMELCSEQNFEEKISKNQSFNH